MYLPGNCETEQPAHRNLRRLIILRNIIILGAATGSAIAIGLFDLALPRQPLLIILAMLALLNLATWLRLKSGHVVSDTEIFAQMLLDIAGITALFYFTGGATNPFVWFFLLPLIIAATILPRLYTWLMTALTVACYTVLLYYNVPLPLPDGGMHHDGGFQMHVFGMWLGFVISAGFVATIIVGMAHNLRARDRKLAEAREQTLQNERLVALGTLAAGAAHELGTPLGTMAILTAELEQDELATAHPDLQKKLGILSSQVRRCKDALSVISTSAGAGRAESGHAMPVGDFLQEVLGEWRQQRPTVVLDTHIGSGPADSMLIAERTLAQALINILNNAADASSADVRLDAMWSASELTLEIRDRGPGLGEFVQNRLGKVPVSTKLEGLGVGLYLAHASIERMGGSLSLHNRTQGGTRILITLPLLAATVPRKDV
ncbi:MAG: ATP-binding protein [Gammaproteobacteria bacterium]